MNCSVIGLGKLGCSMAAAIASRGHSVVGCDTDQGVVDRLAAGVAPVAEPGLQELITAHRDRLHATHSVEHAVQNSDLTFVVVPTPSDARGALLLTHAEQAFARLGAALSRKWTPHTVVLTSTVLPGATRFGLIPALERAAARPLDDRLGVCYSPAFVALGTVIRDFLHPDFLLIGESDEAAGTRLEHAYAEIIPGAPAVRRMSIENAELSKIAVNSFVTMKISFANMLANLCERIPGGDIDVVSTALGGDRRIGRAYLTGALGYGGPCFPRDNRALGFLAGALASSAPLAEATHAFNRALPRHIMARLAPRLADARTAGVLGLAYKPDTPVVEESQSIEIARSLAARGLRVLAHDPLAGAAARPLLGPGIDVVHDVRRVLDEADVILITSPDAAYRELRAAEFARSRGRPLVVDFWRILRSELEEAHTVDYLAVGVSDDQPGQEELLRGLWSTPELLREMT
jgi:UDPglucose 6-dehydrogenase